MPSPVAHTLAGLATLWLSERVRRSRSGHWLAALCVGLALLPDADFLYPSIHRTFTHSVTAAVAIAVAACLLSRRLTGAWNWRLGLICGFAYGSHIALDFFSGDSKSPPGIQALWPISDRWFMSDWLVFRATQTKDLLYPSNIAINVVAVAQELLLLGPLVAALWFARWKRPPAALSRDSETVAADLTPAE